MSPLSTDWRHVLSKEESGHSFINDYSLVLQVEFDAPLLHSVRADDDLICESWRYDEVNDEAHTLFYL